MRFLDYVPETGIATYVDYDHETQISTVIEKQNCDAIIEHNKRLINDKDATKQGIKEGWMLLGTIPLNFIQECALKTGLDPYSREGINWLVKKIHERDFKLLKVANGSFI